ncbi:type II toxin-antitoxin system RelE/ParE family toxin [Shinella sp. G-2]|uniref:type II toxin-antitoxin system RelE/ParE family toxin n=1 Tax=Shinella sp. G-2 TaxID=3133141 RepID=UPI003D087CDC
MKRPVQWSRAALEDMKQQVRHIARDDVAAARSVAERIGAAALLVGERAVGRPGRVSGTYEKSVSGLPYVLAYCIDTLGEQETIFVLRVIHTARHWPGEAWPD